MTDMTTYFHCASANRALLNVDALRCLQTPSEPRALQNPVFSEFLPSGVCGVSVAPAPTNHTVLHAEFPVPEFPRLNLMGQHSELPVREFARFFPPPGLELLGPTRPKLMGQDYVKENDVSCCNHFSRTFCCDYGTKSPMMAARSMSCSTMSPTESELNGGLLTPTESNSSFSFLLEQFGVPEDDDSIRSTSLASVGSELHSQGLCKPCDFVGRGLSCRLGENCKFCHICGPAERRRRKTCRRKSN